MKRTALFACDIDNTIIYSRRHPHAGFTCVEWLQGAEQAYMSPATVQGMAAVLQKCSFIPVTSRSMEQYRRLHFPEGCAPEWCVTANGADLLHNGEADADWRRETEQMIAADVPELLRMHELLRGDERFLRCRIVDGAYLYLHCGTALSPAQLTPALSEMTRLHLIAAGSKIYLLPEKLNKGTAVERLRRRVSEGLLCGGDSDMEMADAGLHRKADAAERLQRRSFGGLICAGDSEMDLPMLEMADVALLPRALRPLWHGRGSCEVPGEGELFSEFVFQRALAVLKG